MKDQEDTFIIALKGEDELGVVVRAHIYIEAQLYELIARMGADPQYIQKMKLDYNQLVNLTVAFGLSAESASSLTALGTLRNAFAHKLNTSLTKDRVDCLYKTLTPQDKKITHDAFEKTNHSIRISDARTSFNSLRPKDRFILIVVSLRAKILAAIGELSGSGDGHA